MLGCLDNDGGGNSWKTVLCFRNSKTRLWVSSTFSCSILSKEHSFYLDTLQKNHNSLYEWKVSFHPRYARIKTECLEMMRMIKFKQIFSSTQANFLNVCFKAERFSGVDRKNLITGIQKGFKIRFFFYQMTFLLVLCSSSLVTDF